MKSNEQQLISNIIKYDIGISETLKGSCYLEEAVVLIVQNPDICDIQVYKELAQRHHCDSATIEHAVEYAIAYSYEKNRLHGFFSDSRGKPKNGEVIFGIAGIIERLLSNDRTRFPVIEY